MTELKYDILVAEDDDQISYILNFILEREGFKVKVANNGKEAQTFIESNMPVKLALLDVMMPYVDGFHLISLIRQSDTWKHVPIVMLSAKSQEKDIVRGLEAGANDYVIKPFQPGELVARIKTLLKRDS